MVDCELNDFPSSDQSFVPFLYASKAGYELVQIATYDAPYVTTIREDGQITQRCVRVELGQEVGEWYSTTWSAWDEQRAVIASDVVSSDEEHTVVVHLLDADLRLLDSAVIEANAYEPAMAMGGGRLLIASYGDPWLLTFDTSAGELVPIAVTPLGSRVGPFHASVTWTGDGFVIVWEESGNPRRVVAARVDRDGALVVGPLDIDRGDDPVLALSDGVLGVFYRTEIAVPEDGGCTPGFRASTLHPVTLEVMRTANIGASALFEEAAVVPVAGGFLVSSTAVRYASGDLARVAVRCMSPMVTKLDTELHVASQDIPATPGAVAMAE